MSEIPFYTLLRQRIAEHAEKDLARYCVSPAKETVKPVTRQRKWLDKFKRIHGMSYSTWLYKKKHASIEQVEGTSADKEQVAQELMEAVNLTQSVPLLSYGS